MNNALLNSSLCNRYTNLIHFIDISFFFSGISKNVLERDILNLILFGLYLFFVRYTTLMFYPVLNDFNKNAFN